LINRNDVRDKDLGELLDPAKCIIDTLINLGLGLIIEKLNLKVKAYSTDLFTTIASREFKNGPAIIAHAVFLFFFLYFYFSFYFLFFIFIFVFIKIK